VFFLIACGEDKPAEVPKIQGLGADANAIARQCARIASCADAHDPAHLRNPSSCVDWWLVSTNAEQSAVECLQSVKTCADLAQCTHEKRDRGAVAFCTAHPGVLGTCDGTRLYNCSDEAEESSAVDCAAFGGSCIEQRVAGGLVVRGCTSAKLCPQNAPISRCDGTAIVRCEDGIAERRECPRGTRCVHVEEQASCEGEPAQDRAQRCSKPGFAACEGNRVAFCTLVGRDAWLRTTDCPRWGNMTCALQNGRANCVSNGGTCTGPARCDGADLLFCAANSEVRVSCKDLGFARCDPAAQAQQAACR